MRIVALGRTSFLYNTIQLLRSNGHKIVLIGTSDPAPEYNVRVEDFYNLALEIGVPFFNDANINKEEIIAELRGVKADIAVSSNWLTLMGAEVLNTFPMGVLNFHGGGLPRYRGNACPNWAILKGEKEAILTIHQMIPELDAGPVVIQKPFSLTEETLIGDFYAFAEQEVPKMFLEAIEGLQSGTITPISQPKSHDMILRCYPRIPADSFMDWNQDACYLDRLVRASSEPFGGAYTYFKGRRLTIWKSGIGSFSYPSLYIPGQVIWRSDSTGEVGIATGNGILVLKEIQLLNESRTKAAKVVKSNRDRLGMMVDDLIADLLLRVKDLEHAVFMEGQ